jgi:hypothetical protein
MFGKKESFISHFLPLSGIRDSRRQQHRRYCGSLSDNNIKDSNGVLYKLVLGSNLFSVSAAPANCQIFGY